MDRASTFAWCNVILQHISISQQHSEPLLNQVGDDDLQAYLASVFGADAIPSHNSNVSRSVVAYVESASGLIEKIKSGKKGRGVYCALNYESSDGSQSQVTACDMSGSVSDPTFASKLELELSHSYHGDVTVSIWASADPTAHPSETSVVPRVPYNAKDRFLGQVTRPVDKLSFEFDAEDVIAHHLVGRSDRSNVAGTLDLALSAQVRTAGSAEKGHEYMSTLVDALVEQQTETGAKSFPAPACAIFERCAHASGLSRGASLIILLKAIAIAFPDSSRLLFMAQYAVDKLCQQNIDLQVKKAELKGYVQMFATRLETMLERYTELHDKESLSATIKSFKAIVQLSRRLNLELTFGVNEDEDCNLMVQDLMQRHFGRISKSMKKTSKAPTIPVTQPSLTEHEENVYSMLYWLRIGADDLRKQVELDQNKFFDTAQSVADIDLFQMAVDGPLAEHYLNTQVILRQFMAETGRGERADGTTIANPRALEQVVGVSAYSDLYFAIVHLLETLDPLLYEKPYLMKYYINYHDDFFPSMLCLIKIKCAQADKWVDNALDQDPNLEFISEGVLHSSSVVDLFSAYNSIIHFVDQLAWKNEEDSTQFIEVIARAIGENLLKYADWLNVQSTVVDPEDCQTQIELDEAEFPKAQAQSNEIKVTPKVCAAMNNIVQSFTQAKLALTPFGEEASRAVEIAVEAGVDGRCVDDAEELSKWQMTVVNEFKHVFQSLYMTLMSMVNRLNNQMRTVLGEQIRVILGSKGGTSKSIRVKGLQQINETSEKVVESSKRMAKWLKLSNRNDPKIDSLHDGRPMAGEVTQLMYKEYVRLLSFLDDEALRLLSTYLTPSTFNHVVRALWSTIVSSILAYVLPSRADPMSSIPSQNYNSDRTVTLSGIQNQSSTGSLQSKRRASPSVAQAKWAHQVLEELKDLFYADAEGVPLEKLNTTEYQEAYQALKAAMLETESLKIRYLMSQLDEGENMRPVQCGPRTLNYQIKIQTLSEAGTGKFYKRAMVQVLSADALPDLGKNGTCNAFVQGNLYQMGEVPARAHTFKYTKVISSCNPQWNDDFSFSIPQSSYGLMLHLAVYHNNGFKAKNGGDLQMSDVVLTRDIFDFDDKDNYVFVGETMLGLDCLLEGDREAVCADLYPKKNFESAMLLELLRNRVHEKNARKFANCRLSVPLGRSMGMEVSEGRTRGASVSSRGDQLKVDGSPLRRNSSRGQSKQHVVQGHIFLARGATVPQPCDVCTKRIVGVGRPLYRCEQCHMQVHKKCHLEVRPCSKSIIPMQKLTAHDSSARNPKDSVARILIPRASGYS